jgi:REP element-mobilizing transposase RayT
MYHVTVRGVDRRALFRSDWDRQRLLMKLAEGVDRFDLDVFLYCLMSNHIHLLVGTPKGNLGRFMGWWLTAYTVYFNLKHNRSGHLTQGRYGAKLVEDDEYLLKLSRYIHLNPIQIASIKKLPIEERFAALRSYRWSSFPGYVLARKAQDFVRYEPMLELVSGGRARPR